MSLYDDWQKSGVGQRTFASRLVEQGMFTSIPRARMAIWEEKKKQDVIRPNPKILFFDIETTPMLVYTWGLWDQNIPYDNIERDWHLLAYSARWFGEKTVGEILTPEEVANQDDERIVKNLWKLLNEADIVVSHNGNKFDFKKVSTRFLYHHLPPPQRFHSIDTYVIAKSVFGFTSNALNYILHYLKLPQKIDNEKGLWKRCVKGEAEALKKMLRYNIRDTDVLEDFYLLLRPYIKNHPNIALYNDNETTVCRNCGSAAISVSNKVYTTWTGVYKTWRCGCGAIGRYKDNEVSKEKRASLLR